jgi:hypothetical protein
MSACSHLCLDLALVDQEKERQSQAHPYSYYIAARPQSLDEFFRISLGELHHVRFPVLHTLEIVDTVVTDIAAEQAKIWVQRQHKHGSSISKVLLRSCKLFDTRWAAESGSVRKHLLELSSLGVEAQLDDCTEVGVFR